MDKDDIHGMWSCITGVTALAGVFGWLAFGVSNRIPEPSSQTIQEGYVLPSKLEIEVDDMDRNGKKEVLLKYDKVPYLLKLDENGKPVIMPYEIRPVEGYLDFEVEPVPEQ